MTILILTLLLTASAAQADDAQREKYARELNAYVVDFMDEIRLTSYYPKRRREARAMIPTILQYCKKYGVDPLHAANIMRHESSWRLGRVGDLGEVGPMQTMPRFFKRMFGLETLDGRIHAGVWWFSQSLKRCKGNVEQAYNYYGMSTCRPVKKFAQMRARRYSRAVKKYRKKGE